MIGFDGFNVSIDNGAGNLAIFDSGVGQPPVEDANSIGPHGIFDTYFEIYQFDFDGAFGNDF